MSRARVLLLLAALATLPRTASAQTASPLLDARWDVSAGAVWLQADSLASRSADLIKNQQTPAPYPLFVTSSELGSAAGFEGRIGFRVTRRLTAEAAFTYARPQLQTHIASDVEGAPDVTAVEPVSHYVVGGSALVHIPELGSKRLVPFVAGGVGYLRQLNDGAMLAQSGQEYHAGGGLKVLIASRTGFPRGVGARVDARVNWRRGGIDLSTDDPVRRSFAVTGGLLVLF